MPNPRSQGGTPQTSGDVMQAHPLIYAVDETDGGQVSLCCFACFRLYKREIVLNIQTVKD